MAFDTPPLPANLPAQAVMLGDRAVELVPGSGVFKRGAQFEGSSAILISAEPSAAGRQRLRHVTSALREMERVLGTLLVHAASDNPSGTWLVASGAVEDFASRRASVTVSGRAGRGTAKQCSDSVRGALQVLALLGRGSVPAPTGIDWLACDQQGRWVLNILDRGLWIDEPGRTWQSAAYDVAWTVALGREPSMRDPAAYDAVSSCPAELSHLLKRLAGHASPAFASPAEALSSLNELVPRRVLRATAIVALTLAAVTVASMAWIDARIAARARAIEERSDIDVFQRSTDLATLLQQHPMLLFWRGTAHGRLARLNAQCAREQTEWKRKVDETLAQPASKGKELEHTIVRLLAQCKPFADDVTIARGQLEVKLAQVRAEVLLSTSDPSFMEAVDAARALRKVGLSTDPLIGRLQAAADDARWRACPAPPRDGDTVAAINAYVAALKAYLADVPEDIDLGGKLRRHKDEANRLIDEARAPIERAVLAELDKEIDRFNQRGVPAFAAAAICEKLRAPDNTDWMRAQLQGRAVRVAEQQKVRIEGRLERNEQLAEIAKEVVDWQEVVGRDVQAFPREDVMSLAQQVIARFVSSVITAERVGDIPPLGDSLQRLSRLAGGRVAEELPGMVESRTQGLRMGSTNLRLRAWWHFNRIAEQVGLARAEEVLRYPDVNAVVIRLRAQVEDHWGNDWIARVAVEHPLVDNAGREVAADLARPIVFLIPEAEAVGDLYVLDGHRIGVTVWDDDFGEGDPVLFRGSLVFTQGQIRLETQQGAASAVSVTLENVRRQ